MSRGLAAPEIGLVETALRRAIAALPTKLGAVWNIIHSGGTFTEAGHLIGLSAGRCSDLYREANYRVRDAIRNEFGEDDISLDAIGAERDMDLIASARRPGWTEAAPMSDEWREAAREKARESRARLKERREWQAEMRWMPPRSCTEAAKEVLPNLDWSDYPQCERSAEAYSVAIWWSKGGISVRERHALFGQGVWINVQTWAEVPDAVARMHTEVCAQKIRGQEERIAAANAEIRRLHAALARTLAELGTP